MTTDVVLPSGATLKITLAPFPDGKALYTAVMEEAKSLKLDANAEADFNFFKDIFCTTFASKKIDAALEKCMERALYKGVHITKDTFESLDAREDYLSVCFEVANVNLRPFLKHLSLQWSALAAQLHLGHTSK